MAGWPIVNPQLPGSNMYTHVLPPYGFQYLPPLPPLTQSVASSEAMQNYPPGVQQQTSMPNNMYGSFLPPYPPPMGYAPYPPVTLVPPPPSSDTSQGIANAPWANPPPLNRGASQGISNAPWASNPPPQPSPIQPAPSAEHLTSYGGDRDAEYEKFMSEMK